jgi:hypothetical protein
MDAKVTPPASSSSPSPSGRGWPEGPGEGAAAPILPVLSPAEESRFRAAARWSGDPMELAEVLHLPYSELLHWLAEPRIERLLDQHHRFTALCETNRQRETKLKVSTALTTDFDDTEDPKERRRISNPLLRATTPTRPTLTRARAGAAPSAAGRGGGAGVPPAAAREASAASTPDLNTLPPHIATAWTEADQAITAFSHTPPRISKQAFLETVTTYADTWESHHARASAESDPFAHTQDARPLARPAPSSQSPSPNPQSKIQNPKSPEPASALLTCLHTALSHFNSPGKSSGLQTLLDLSTPDLTVCGRVKTDLPRLTHIAEHLFNTTKLRHTIEIEEPPEALTLTTILKLRRGTACPRIHITLTRATPTHPWLIHSITDPRPP